MIKSVFAEMVATKRMSINEMTVTKVTYLRKARVLGSLRLTLFHRTSASPGASFDWSG